MMKILTGLMVIVCTAVLISGCGDKHAARIIELDSDLPAGTLLTTISWEDRTICVISSGEAEIKGREVIIHNPIGIMGGKEYNVDWSLPIKTRVVFPSDSYLSLFIAPNTTDCWVCIDKKCVLFPKEVE